MKTLEEAQNELAVVTTRYSTLGGISGSEELARLAGVPVSAVRYLKKRVGEKPCNKEVKKVFETLRLKGAFADYVNCLVDQVFPREVPQSIINNPLSWAERGLHSRAP